MDDAGHLIDFNSLYEVEKKTLNIFVDEDPLPVEMFIGQHIAVLGKSGVGKSVTNAVLMEEFCVTGIIHLIFDTEGDYPTLKSWKPHKYSVISSFKSKRRKTIPAKRDRKGNVKENARVEVTEEWNYRRFTDVCDTLMGETIYGEPVERRSVVVLINKYSKEDRLEIIYKILSHLWEERIRPAEQHEAIAVLLDEAHEKIPQSRSAHPGLLTLIEDIAKLGRKVGLGLVISSQRPAEVQKNALAQCQMIFFLKVDEHLDIEAYALRLPLEDTMVESKRRLKQEFKFFQPGSCFFKYQSFEPGKSGIVIRRCRFRYSKHSSENLGVDSLVQY